MCCFAKTVLSVSNTNLFARLSRNGTQFLVYQMQFKSEQVNAMILPLPTTLPARDEAVRFVSFEKYDSFFQDLNSGFPVESPPTLSRSFPPTNSKVDAKLEVHEVGQFVASFVPSLSDFDRLDPQFVIPKESWDKIPEYSDYGFAVFQLKELSGKPHPMAFEFPTRFRDRVFFPTVHIHDGQVHPIEEFDHMLYAQDSEFDKAAVKYLGPKGTNSRTGLVRSKGAARDFMKIGLSQGFVEGNQLVHRMEVRGRHANTDFTKKISADLVSMSDWSDPVRRLWPFGPGLLALAGLGWFIRRRARVMTDRSQ